MGTQRACSRTVSHRRHAAHRPDLLQMDEAGDLRVNVEEPFRGAFLTRIERIDQSQGEPIESRGAARVRCSSDIPSPIIHPQATARMPGQRTPDGVLLQRLSGTESALRQTL